MTEDPFRYRLIDEPRPSPLARIALPPTLVFLVATFFQPWGYVLIVFNAIALNGPYRNREILLALAPFPIYFGALRLLDMLVLARTVPLAQAHYWFVGAIGLGLASAAFAYVSQERTYQLRRYLDQLRGYSA
ncbi:MAG TPA: hypothetical protein VF079_02135 [Sphingomicrobium sp.]